MELQQYARLIVRYWLILLLALVLGAGVGVALTRMQSAEYRSTTVLGVVGASGATTPGRAYQGQLLAQGAVATFADLATSRAVLQQTADALGEGVTVAKLTGAVTAEVPEGTNLVEVTVDYDDAEGAQRIATQVGTSLAAVGAQLVPSDATGPSLVVVQPADLPEEPLNDGLVLNALLGAMLGLLLGIAVAAVHLYFRGSLHNRDDLGRILPAPLLGEVGLERSGDGRSASTTDLRDVALLVLERGTHEAGPIVLAGATSKAAADTVAAHLAELVAASGSRVLLVSDELTEPEFKGRMLPGSLTLGGDHAVGPGETQRLFGLHGGLTHPSRPVMSGNRLQAALSRAALGFDVVVVAAPPLSDSIDAAVLGDLASSTILVVAARGTSRSDLARATRSLATTSCEVHGVVLTRRART